MSGIGSNEITLGQNNPRHALLSEAGFIADRESEIITLAPEEILNIQIKTIIGNLEGHDGIVTSLEITKDSKYIISGSSDAKILVWDTLLKTIESTLIGHIGEITCLLLSSTSKYLLSGSKDCNSILWNFEERTKIIAFIGHSQQITSVALAEDFTYAITCSDDGFIKVWDYKGNLVKDLTGNTVKVTSCVVSSIFLITGSNDGRILAWNLTSLSLDREIFKATQSIVSLSISPNGKLFASAEKNENIKLWSVQSLQLEFEFKDRNNIKQIKFSGNSEHLLVISDNCYIYHCNADSIKRDFAIDLYPEKPNTLCVNSDCSVVVIGLNSKGFRIWNSYERRDDSTLHLHDDGMSIACTSDERFLLSGSLDKSFKVYNLVTDKVEWEIKSSEPSTSKIYSLSRFNNILLSSHDDGSIKFWDIETKRMIKSFKPHKSIIWDVAVNEELGLAASGSDDKKIIVFDLNSLEEAFTLSDSTHAAFSLIFTKNSQKLISGGDDFCIKIWCIQQRTEECSISGHMNTVTSLGLTKYEDFLFSSSADNTIKLWDLGNNFNEHTFEGHLGEVTKIILMTSKNYLISASVDKSIKFWNLNEKKLDFTLDGHKGSLKSIKLNLDETNLFSCGDDFIIIIWNIHTRSIEFSLSGHFGVVRDLTILNESTIISCSEDKSIVIWDLESKKMKEFIYYEIGKINTVAISNNNGLAAIGCDNKEVIIVDMIKKTHLLLGRHSDIVWCVAFSNDSKLLASGCKDKTIKIWGLEKLKEDCSFIGHTNTVVVLTFNFNSKLLISGSYDNTLRTWNLESKKIEHIFNYSLPIHCVVSSKKENLIYFGCEDRFVRAICLNQKKVLYSTPKTGTSTIGSIALDIAEKLMFYNDFNNIIVFDTVNKIVLFKLSGHARSSILGIVYLSNKMKLISCANDKMIKFWSLAKSREAKMIGFEKDNKTTSMSITNNRDLLVCGLFNGEIKIWNTKDQSIYFRAKAHSEEIATIKISSDDKIFSSGSNDRLIKVWSIAEKKLLFTLTGHSNFVNGLLFIKNDKILISASLDQTIRFWDLYSQKEVQSFKEHQSDFYCIHQYSDMIVSGSGDKKIVFWDFKSKVFELIGHNGIVYCITSAGENLISGSEDKSIKVWDILNRNIIFTFTSHSNAVMNLLLLNDDTLISSSLDKTVKVWNLEKLREVESFKMHNDYVFKFAKFDSSKFISCSRDGTIRKWDINNRGESGIFKGTTYNFTAILIVSNYLFIGTKEGCIILYDLEKAKETEILYGHTGRVSSIEFFISESILISGSWDNIIFWDIKKKEIIEKKIVHTNWIKVLRITPDQNHLLSASGDGTIIIWGLTDRNILQTLRGHKAGVNDIRISNDSAYIFSSSSDKTIKIWELNTGKEICCLVGHTNSINSLVLIEEQATLVSCSSDRLIKFWNYELKREIFTLMGHTDIVLKLELTQDKKYLLSVGNDKTINIWNICEKRLEFALKDALYTAIDVGIIQDSNLFYCCFAEGIVKQFQIQPSESNKIRKLACENFHLICDNKSILEVVPFTSDPFSQFKVPIQEFVPTHPLDAGFNDLQAFYLFIDSLKQSSISKYAPGTAFLKISSCLYGVAHILSFLGKEEELLSLFSSESIVITCDVFGKSPFYYAIVANHDKCGEIILDFLIKGSKDMGSPEMMTSMYAIRNDFELLIRSSIIQIGKFLECSLLRSKPTFVLSSIQVPSSSFNIFPTPASRDFDEISSLSGKKQVYFMSFQTPISVVSGSDLSIQLTTSILNCQDKAVIGSIVIKEFIDSQWASLYWIIVFNSVTYLLNLSLILYLLTYGFTWIVVIPFLIFNFILVIWEIVQFLVSWRSFLQDYWNFFDLLGIGFSVVWVFNMDMNDITLVTVMIILNFIRGITAFKIIDGTRYYIKLIFLSISELKYFLLMFLYSNIALGVLYSVRNGNQIDIIGSIFKIYSLNFGYFDSNELTSYFDIWVFITATIINLIVMLNLLISILGDFHDQFQIERVIIDYQEKAEACLEIQKLLFWRRNNNEKKYLHKIYKVGETENIDAWEGRIIFIKNQIDSLGSTFNDSYTNLSNKISKNIEMSGTDIKEKFVAKVDENRSFIESKVKEVYELVESKQGGNSDGIKFLDGGVESMIREENKLLENRVELMIKEVSKRLELMMKEENKLSERKVELMLKEETRLLGERLSTVENGIVKILEKLSSQ